MTAPDYRPVVQRFPRVPFKRRFYAFALDFCLVWLGSSFVGAGPVQGFVFVSLWLVLRVVVVDRNAGQSLGMWCLDIKVMGLRFRRVPDVYTLGKRELTLGIEAGLAMTGLNLFFFNPFTTLLLVSPIVIDCALAYTDEQFNQAIHDRLFDTVMIQTKRGYSLDVRIGRLLAEVRQRMQR